MAGAISAGVTAAATRLMGDTPTGRIVATAAPILVMTMTFMILEQLKIAHDIVVTTYTLLLGSIAWRRLAFGLGGRDVAALLVLEGAYQKGQREAGQVKQDIQRARDEAEPG